MWLGSIGNGTFVEAFRSSSFQASYTFMPTTVQMSIPGESWEFSFTFDIGGDRNPVWFLVVRDECVEPCGVSLLQL